MVPKASVAWRCSYHWVLWGGICACVSQSKNCRATSSRRLQVSSHKNAIFSISFHHRYLFSPCTKWRTCLSPGYATLGSKRTSKLARRPTCLIETTPAGRCVSVATRANTNPMQHPSTRTRIWDPLQDTLIVCCLTKST